MAGSSLFWSSSSSPPPAAAAKAAKALDARSDDKESPSRSTEVINLIHKDIMSQPPSVPSLTPQYCVSKGGLRDFLRTSRRAIDDTIVENLNALVTPSRDGFDTSSTSQRALLPSKRLIAPESCNNFKDNVLFPSWKARTDVLNYCESVANPLEPKKSRETTEATNYAFPKPDTPLSYDRSDPYKTRSLTQETEMDRLANLVRNQQTVEQIIRVRTWALVAERCGSYVGGLEADSEAALQDWQRRKGS